MRPIRLHEALIRVAITWSILGCNSTIINAWTSIVISVLAPYTPVSVPDKLPGNHTIKESLVIDRGDRVVNIRHLHEVAICHEKVVGRELAEEGRVFSVSVNILQSN